MLRIRAPNGATVERAEGSTTLPEALVYDFAVESLFRGLGDEFTPELRAQVKAAGIDPDSPLLPAYPRAIWTRVVDVLSVALARGRSLEDARRDLGQRITQGFAQTTLGRVMSPAARLLGVRRTLARLPRNFTITNNFMKCTLTEKSPTELVFDVTEPVPSAEFLAGVIDSMARYAGAGHSRVTIEQLGTATRFHVTWT